LPLLVDRDAKRLLADRNYYLLPFQGLPFAGRKALALCDAFERGVYQLAV
jgi:hypothetical protein